MIPNKKVKPFKVIFNYFKLLGNGSFLVLFLVQSLSCFSQTRVTENYTFNSFLNGRAEYNFNVVALDTLKNVNFRLTSDTTDGEQNFSKFELFGTYSNNIKNGLWTLEETELTTTGTKLIEDFKVVNFANGITTRLKTNYKTSKVDGQWNLNKKRVEASKPQSEIVDINLNFKNNTLNGDFEIIYKNFKITGTVDQDGYANGDWQFRYLDSNSSEYLEVYKFNNGVLLGHYLLFENQKTDFKYDGLMLEENNQTNNLIEVDLNDSFFDIINFYNQSTDRYSLQKIDLDETNKTALSYLDEALKLVSNYHFKISESGDNYPLKFANIKLNYFPFNAHQKDLLKACTILNNKIKLKIEQLYNNSQIEIERYNNSELNEYFNLINIYKNQLKNYTEITAIINDKSFDYIDKNVSLVQILPELKYSKSIHLNLGVANDIYGKHLPDDVSFQEFNLEKIKTHFSLVLDNLISVENEVQRMLDKNKKETDLFKLEQTLLSQKEQIDSLFGNADIQGNDYLQQVSSFVVAFAQKEFEAYAALDTNRKSETANQLNNCFENLISLHAELSYQTTKDERLDEAFSRVILNPYTMTDMTERLKPRIYNAYYNFVLPYLLDNVSQNLNCNSLETDVAAFDRIFQKMLELRDEETKEIERLLRRQDNVRSILSILDITTN